MRSTKSILIIYLFSKKIGFNLLIFFSILILNSGCLDENLKNIDGIIAQPEYAVPVGKASFSIAEFIKTDSIFTTEEDGLIAIKHRQDSVLSLSAKDFLDNFGDLWNAKYYQENAVGTANIPNINETGMFYMQALVDEIPDPMVRQFFRTNNGNTVPIPAFEQTVNFDIGIPIFEEYQKIELEKGILKFDATNAYPFDLEDVTFQVWDNVAGTLIGSVHSDLIKSGEIFEQDILLDGKTIHNSVFVRLLKFKSPGSTSPVLINLMNRINTRMELVGLQIRTGTLKVSPISFDPFSDMVQVQTDNNVKLKAAKIESGKLNYNIESSLGLPVKLVLELPTVLKNGIPYRDTFNVTNGNDSGILDIQDYKVDFGTNSGQPFNMLPVILTTMTPGSGNDYVNFDATDLMKVSFQLEEIVIDEFLGNAGTYTQTLDSSHLDFGVDFSFLEPETKETFLENPEIEVFYSNSFGIPMSAQLHINADGNFGGNEDLKPSIFSLDYPAISQIGTSINSVYKVNKSNSNIVDFLSIYPTSVDYAGTVIVNPLSNNDLDNYITLDSKITAGIDLKLPLKFKTSLLVLKDTLSTEPIVDEVPEMIESIQFTMDYINDLPMDTRIDLISSRLGIETPIVENLVLKGATVDATGNKIESTKDRVILDLTEKQIEILMLNDILIMKINLSTVMEGNTEVGVYTSDGLEIGVSAKVKLRIQE